MFREQIEAGDALLDSKLPGWAILIDLEKLDISDTCDCIVGQTFPAKVYSDALTALFGVDDGLEALDMAHQYGFCIPPDGNSIDYPQLTQEWIEYIEEKRDHE